MFDSVFQKVFSQNFRLGHSIDRQNIFMFLASLIHQYIHLRWVLIAPWQQMPPLMGYALAPSPQARLHHIALFLTLNNPHPFTRAA